MKIRQGFVSNSSSSSFVCDLTGEVFEGYDASLSDFDLVECENCHTFVYTSFPEVVAWVQDEEQNYDGNYGLPEKLCPICNGKAKEKLVKRLKNMMENLNIVVDDLV